jgi:hypothetical protein
MPEEIEVPTEHLHEQMEEAAHEGHEGHGGHAGPGERKGGSNFNMQVALTSAVIAVFAAICALMAGHHANEALLEQLEASDQWNYYQAKGIKETVLKSKVDLLATLGKRAVDKDSEKLAEYDKDKKDIQEKADEKEKSSAAHMAHHVIFAKAVTFFQIAIALSAMAVLTRKHFLWFGSLGLGLLGSYYMAIGFF